MSSLLLSADWDISLDSNGDLKTTEGNYATAQNAACRCRAFTNDMYFNQADGVPHFLVDISQRPNPSVVATAMEKVAVGTEDVSKASMRNISLSPSRTLEGEIYLTLDSGEKINVTI